MNTSLTFEVLLYLNSYYFGLFAVCEIGMNVVKAINLDIPNFSIDLVILVIVCVLELIRVVIARKGNFTEKCKCASGFLIKFCKYFLFCSVAGVYSDFIHVTISCWGCLLYYFAECHFAVRIHNLCHPASLTNC